MSNASSIAATPERSGANENRVLSANVSILTNGSSKIRDCHLERLAVVYVRQSSPHQVIENRESTALQYGLAHRAVALGWSKERVLVIDEDQGLSGRTAEGRLGFQRLLAEVGLNHVGLVLGIEMSRLARSCKDWHQLLELCALFAVLLADQDGLYDPADYNDRLLLGLKGTMSEAELHILRGRMEQGRQNKAKRGELILAAPMGYVKLSSSELAFDPDEQAQAVIRLIFDKFEELGSVMGVLRYLLQYHLRLPIRPKQGPNRGQLVWQHLKYDNLITLLRHPAYAGAYTYGRHPIDPRRRVPGKPGSGKVKVPIDQWKVLHKDRFPAYITWERYLANRRQLRQNATRFCNRGVAREGPALLVGLVYCGYCGRRMQVVYQGKPVHARYYCDSQYKIQGHGKCQSFAGQVLEELVCEQVFSAIEPATLALSLQAGQDIQRERNQLHKHWRQRMERAQYEAERAKRQYDAVEPENRLVVRELERRWEQHLLEDRRLREEYDRFCHEQPEDLSPAEHQQILAIATDLPALWNAHSTTTADRKTIIRHLIEKVVVAAQHTTEFIDVTIHWKGSFLSQHQVVRSIPRYTQLSDYARLKSRVIELRDSGHTAREIAKALNREGFRTPQRGKTYDAVLVRRFISHSGLSGPHPASSAARSILGSHEFWISELARRLEMPVGTLGSWCRRGWVHARQLDSKEKTKRYWVIWADRMELHRLRQLRACRPGPPEAPYPLELTTPGPRSHT